MSNQFVVALDQGTTSSRAVLIDKKGTIFAAAQKEFKQIFPQPGWVEHDPAEIWASQYEVARDVINNNGVDSNTIGGIGITNQRETTVVWDRTTGRHLYNAIVWQDRRTSEFCDELKSRGLIETIRRKTGLLIDAYFSATKLKWILDNITGARALAEKGQLAFGTIDTWLVWNLTQGNVHVTDATNASRTMLFNIHSLTWDDALLDIFNIPQSILPEVKSSSEIYAETAKGIFNSTLPICGVAGDQQAALFGQMCVEEGMIKIIADKKTDKVVGAHIIGPNATEIIGEIVAYMKMEATLKDIAETIHAHPTVSECILEAALDAKGESVHLLKR